jgi:hypothetical protein
MISQKDIRERQQKPYTHESGNSRLHNFGFCTYEQFMTRLEQDGKERIEKS